VIGYSGQKKKFISIATRVKWCPLKY
jgi:hypothetical protein